VRVEGRSGEIFMDASPHIPLVLAKAGTQYAA
jgi:hypothetical protein